MRDPSRVACELVFILSASARALLWKYKAFCYAGRAGPGRAGPARGLQGVWVPALMFISPRSPANLYRTLMTRSKSSRRRRKACPAALMRASLQTTSALTQNKSRKPAQTSDSYKKVVILVTAHSFSIFSVPNNMSNESPIPEMLRIAQVTNWNEKNVITSS